MERSPLEESSAENDMGSQEAVEQAEQTDKVLKIGNREYKQGSIVSVERSDGSIEKDWQLKSWGNEFAIVERETLEGEHLKKTVPLEEFKTLQEKTGLGGARRLGSAGTLRAAKSFGVETEGKNPEEIVEEMNEKF